MKVVEYYYKNSIFGVYIMRKGYMLQDTCSKFIVGISYTKNLWFWKLKRNLKRAQENFDVKRGWKSILKFIKLGKTVVSELFYYIFGFDVLNLLKIFRKNVQ